MFKNHRMSQNFSFRNLTCGERFRSDSKLQEQSFQKDRFWTFTQTNQSETIAVMADLQPPSSIHPSVSSIQPLKLKVVRSDNKKQVDTLLYQTCCMRGDGVGVPQKCHQGPHLISQTKTGHRRCWSTLFGVSTLSDPPEAQVRGILVFWLSLAVSNACVVKSH